MTRSTQATGRRKREAAQAQRADRLDHAAADQEAELMRRLMDAQAACPPSYIDNWVRNIQPLLDFRVKQIIDTRAEVEKLKALAKNLHWMARRYADGRQSYATSLHNENTRALLAMGVQLNATGDGTLWARDSAGRAYDGLTDEEAAQGRQPDWRHDDKERQIEEQAALVGQLATALREQRDWHERQQKALGKSGRRDREALWASGRHREQIEEIDRVLATSKPDEQRQEPSRCRLVRRNGGRS